MGVPSLDAWRARRSSMWTIGLLLEAIDTRLTFSWLSWLVEVVDVSSQVG